MVAKTEETKAAEAEEKATEEEAAGEFSGQNIVTANFNLVTGEDLGRPQLEIKPIGWVGPGFSVPPSRVKELIKALQSIKNLPEQEKVAKDDD